MDINYRLIQIGGDIKNITKPKPLSKQSRIDKRIEYGESPMIYGDVNLYKRVEELWNSIRNNSKYNAARRLLYPFDNLTGPFINRSAMILANIDALFRLTGNIGQQMLGIYRYIDVAGGPGGWSQYIQYRKPTSVGYGISLVNVDKALRWSDKLDYSRFSTYNDKDGDVNVVALDFIDYVKKIYDKIDLVMADGGFEIESRHEYLSSRLILSESLIGLSLVSRGGNFIIKMYTTFTKFIADIITILNHSFNEVYIFKPLMSKPTNNERYIICMGRNDYNEGVDILKEVWNHGKEVKSILNDYSFDELSNINNTLTKLQLDNLTMLKRLIDGDSVEIPLYDVDRCYIFWDIPYHITSPISSQYTPISISC